ncbi:MAG: hypothetical protein IJS59_02610 [Bacteroidaceae bacterium]|nr:hypothetical protein [Bacteroidaceae bacterium]
MNLDNRKHHFMALAIASGISLAAFTACDTPKSIAWSYYHCAKDTLAAGDAHAAKHFLNRCKRSADPALAPKVDSLAKVIESAITEKEK